MRFAVGVALVDMRRRKISRTLPLCWKDLRRGECFVVVVVVVFVFFFKETDRVLGLPILLDSKI